jgi:hypothetical protein
MADNGWSDGICPTEPGLPKLLLLSLGRVGVVDPPEYTYREHSFRGTPRCDLMIFVGKSTLYPDVDPWFISEKPCDAYAWSIGIIFSELLWDFSHLLEGEDARGLPG